MRTLLLVAILAAFVALPAIAQQDVQPPVPAQPAPSLMPQGQVVNPPSRGATPAAPPGTGASLPDAAQRAPSASPPDTVQGNGGSCVHPPCPQAPPSK